MKRPKCQRRGIALIAVLIVIAILSLSAYTSAQMLTVENELSSLEVRRIQARYHADSAAALVAALLAARQRGQDVPNLHDNAGLFSGIAFEGSKPPAPSDPSVEMPAATGRAAVFVPSLEPVATAAIGSRNSRGPAAPDSLPIRFGIEREAGRIHVMRWLGADPDALRRALLALPRSNEALVDAVLDWLDDDDVARPAGAERREYESSPLALRPRNGAIDSLDELLLVRGMTRAIWFGARDGREPGWRDFLTLASHERNVDRFGRPRLWLNDPHVERLSAAIEKEFGAPLAQFVRAFRAAPGAEAAPARVFRSVWELVDSAAFFDGKPIASPLRSTDPALREQFPALLDRLTATRAASFVGRLDLLSASPAALELLPLTSAQRQAIVEQRPAWFTQGATLDQSLGRREGRPPETLAWLLTERILTVAEIIALEPHVTAGSPVVRFQAAGFYDAGREAVRVEYVIDGTFDPPRIVERRPLDRFGIGLPLPLLGQGLPHRPLFEVN